MSHTLFRKNLHSVTAMLKVLSQQLQGTLTTTFERHFTNEDFMEMDRRKFQACTKTCDLLLHPYFSQTSLFFKFNLMLIEQAYFSNLP